MSEYFENLGQLENTNKKKEICISAIKSYKDSIRRHLSVFGEAQDVDGDLIVALAISLNEKCIELAGHNRKIAVLERALGR